MEVPGRKYETSGRTPVWQAETIPGGNHGRSRRRKCPCAPEEGEGGEQGVLGGWRRPWRPPCRGRITWCRRTFHMMPSPEGIPVPCQR
eukprot:9278583-Heterocapsa_arctica.AAC.1